jgi:hypothetical protein
MRAKEFVNEIAPIVGAIGRSLAKGALGAAGAIGSAALGSNSNNQTTQPQSSTVNKTTGTNTAVIPATPIQTTISSPNELEVKLGDANFKLDLKDPKNSQILQQLKQTLK